MDKDKKKLQEKVYAMMKILRLHIEEKVNEYGYKIIPVDDEHSLEVNIELAAEYFSLPLRN